MLPATTPVHRYLRAWKGLGGNVGQLLAGTDLEAGLLQDPACLLELEQSHRLLENLARADAGRGLGLDIGLDARMEDLGLLGHVAFCCRTPRQSTEGFWPHYGRLFGLIGTPEVVSDSGDFTVLEIHTPPLSDRALRLCIDETLIWLVAVGGQVVGRRAPVQRLELPFAAPSYQDRYGQLFQCPVHFKARRPRVAVHREWFEQRLPTQDAHQLQRLQAQLAQISAEAAAQTPLVSRVRHVLLSSGPERLPSLVETATHLGMSERSLSRHLQHSGTSYRQLVEAFRVRLAADVLAEGGTQAKAVAFQLGFHNIAAFRRAFKQWTGLTLSEYRRAISASDTASVPGLA